MGRRSYGVQVGGGGLAGAGMFGESFRKSHYVKIGKLLCEALLAAIREPPPPPSFSLHLTQASGGNGVTNRTASSE